MSVLSPDHRRAALRVADLLSALLSRALGAKARDGREPGRARKERTEEALERVVLAHLRRSARRMREYLETRYLDRKAAPDVPGELFEDDEFSADLARLFGRAVRDGVALFSDLVDVQIDYSLVNTRALAWARKYTPKLSQGILDTTRDAFRQALAAFVETPGMTIGDVMEAIAYSVGENRARQIAITETTRIYGAAAEEAGKQLRAEWPDLLVVKTWHTNNDDRVCPICAPLDGMQIDVDSGFTTEEGGREGVPHPPAHTGCRCWMSTRTVSDV